MKTLLSFFGLLVTLIALLAGNYAGAVAAFIFGNVAVSAAQPGRFCVTLQTSEMLLDVLHAFRKQYPAAQLLGGNFKSQGLRIGKTYYCHVAGTPNVEDVTTTYAVTGNSARGLLSDIPIVCSKRKGAQLYWENLYNLTDDKFAYERVIAEAGAAVGKAFFEDLGTLMRSEYFSYGVTYATADADNDMLNDITGTMNANGAAVTGRVLLVNGSVANTLSNVAQLNSRDYLAQQQGEMAIRSWKNVAGYKLIQEWTDLPSNNSTAITGVSLEADDETFTKASHGLVTGQRVCLTAITGGTGFTAGTYYWVIKLTANTFQLASTLANAVAGTAVAASLDGSSITITPAENLIAFASDGTAINFVAGPEDHSEKDALAQALGIQQIISVESIQDPDSGLTMSAVKYQEPGTGKLVWMPVLLWGKTAGRQDGANAVGSYTDKGGLLVHSA